jgi:arylsulfatase A-like enzyme/Flp pilus assembly protein TadD
LIAVVAVLASFGCRHAAAPPPRTPLSIVLVTIDTLRADYVSARLTPALDRLAQESIVFQNAITVAPLTLPAHASLLTGQNPPRHRVRDNSVFALPDDILTFPMWLKRHGYATAAFVSAVVLDHRYGLNRGFDVYDDEIAGPERPARDTLARAERWLESTPDRFFVWIHLFEPHAPYRTGSYGGEVAAVDQELAAFFQFLRERRLWNTIVVSITSDHGESLGEHGEQTHGFFLYDATLRIPWLLKAPSASPGTFPHQVRIVDELPTVLELAGTDPLRDPGFAGAALDGGSVAELVERKRSPNLEAYSETFLPRDQFGWSELKSIRTERLKYIEAPQAEAYDLASDPAETRNIIAERPAAALPLKRTLAALEGSASASVRHAPSDPVLVEKFMALGYIGYSPAPAAPRGALPDPKSKLEVYNLTMNALELSERGEASAALEKLRRAERLDPNVAQVEFLTGTILGKLGRFPDAARALERTLELNPRYTAARLKLALAYLRMGQHGPAERALSRVLHDEPQNVRAYHDLAAVAYSAGNLSRAEELERKALAIDPRYAEAWNTLGAIYVVQKNPAAAVDALTTATRLSPANGQAFYNLALALGAAGEVEQARAARARACAVDPKYCAAKPGISDR